MNPKYQETRFDVGGELPSSFAIITAYNPLGRNAPESRNRHQDQTLRAVLVGRGATPVRVTGFDPEGDHREPGWAAELSLKDALAIGRTFKQNAIYYVDQGALSLHTSLGDRQTTLGPFDERVNTLTGAS